MPLEQTPTTQRLAPTPDGPSPSAYSELDVVPRTQDEAAMLLAQAARALRRGQQVPFVARQLARFLGAASSVWTYDRRGELRSLLRAAGREGLLAALKAVAEHPVSDVIDEAARLAEQFAREQPIAIASLLDWPPISEPDFQQLAAHPAVRVVAARALTRADGRPVLESLLRALRDPSVEVRDAVVEVLAMRGDPAALPALHEQLRVESEELVRSALADAVQELASAP